MPNFDERDCREVLPEHEWNDVDRNRFRCGYFYTWENYDSQTDTIRLAVMETYPRQQPRPEPVMWLAGGPGGSGFPLDPATAIKRTDYYGRGWIQFSQRGSYLSQSTMYCPQVRAAVIRNWETTVGEKPPNWEQWISGVSDAFVQCYGSLGQDNGWDYLPSINSKFNALDVIYLIRLLGYGNGSINLHGGSYGTLLAQHVLALSPGDLRSVVLVGVAPLGVDWNAEYPRNLRESLQLIFDACRTSTECHQAYPNLEHTFLMLLDQIKEEPLCLPVEDTGTTFSNVCLDDYGYLLVLGNLVSETENLKKIPRIIYGSWNQDLEQITELGASYYSLERNAGWPWGMYYSIYCSEFPRFDPDNIDLRQVEQPFQTLYAATKQLINKVCLIYDQYGTAYGSTSVVNNKVPVLVFNGKFDPLTPEKYGNQVADVLSVTDDFEFTSETSAHDSTGSNCAAEIIKNFFDDPEKPPDRAFLLGRKPCWNAQDKTIDFELATPNPGIEPPEGGEIPGGIEAPWWDELWTNLVETVNGWAEGIRTGWQEIPDSINDQVNQWLQEQQEKARDAWNKWLQEQQEKAVKWLWQQYFELLSQCFGSALLPAGALTSAWVYRGKKRKSLK